MTTAQDNLDSHKYRSLYVHFPFCETKCHYCDFYSIGREKTSSTELSKFEQALHLEAKSSSDLLAPKLNTIFFGGGTPSMTPASVMSQILEPLQISKRLTPETEWTMEANPSSVSIQSLKDYRSLGVNRISMGVQAMNDELLHKLGRVHSSEKAIEALNAIFEAGFNNVSVDLLCGVPGQSTEELKRAMEVLTRFPIQHLSCYLLTLPSSHRMFKELPHEDQQLEHLLTIDEFMVAKGFEHYEISNFAKPSREAKHNLNYWKGESYLGLGPSAHSYSSWNSKRFKNWNALHRYHDLLSKGQAPQEWEEILTPDQKEIEKWMLALRLAEGFSEEWLITPKQKSHAKRLMQESLLTFHPHKFKTLRLTPKGFALSDQIVKGFI